MRKVSMFVGLALFALAGSARAQESAPPPAADAPTTAPAGDTAAAPAPAPETVAAPAAAAAASDSKMQAGVNLLPVLLGKSKNDVNTQDAAFGYGFGLSFGYAVIPGLYVGVAPQLLLGLKAKDAPAGVPNDSSKAIDILARVAYVYTVMPKLGLYVEALPGYSIIMPPSGYTGSKPKGFVIAGGVGATYDVTDQVYLNLSVGYEYGLQKADSAKDNFSFLRIALGAGAKF